MFYKKCFFKKKQTNKRTKKKHQYFYPDEEPCNYEDANRFVCYHYYKKINNKSKTKKKVFSHYCIGFSVF